MSRYHGPQDYRDGRPSVVTRRRKRAEAEERNARTLPQNRRAYWREWWAEAINDLPYEVVTGQCPWPEKTAYENESIALAALKGIAAHKRRLQGLHPYPCKPTGHWHLGRILRRATFAWKRAA